MTKEQKTLPELSNLPKTWLFDIDGTIVYHNSDLSFYDDTLLPRVKEFFEEKIAKTDKVILLTARKNHKWRTKRFLKKNGIRFDKIIFGLPYGERLLFNDIKPKDKLKTAYSFNVIRNVGIGEYL